MNKERQYIKNIATHLPRSTHQVNRLFESDSEIIAEDSGYMLLTVDEFSAEDLFLDSNPFYLGWNLAVATISDILASGGIPKYFSHSIVVDKYRWDETFISGFGSGIADLLKRNNIAFLGGDVGFSEHWHYTGVAIGRSDSVQTRVGAKAGDIIMMTGVIGGGNLEAAINLYQEKVNCSAVLGNYHTRLANRINESGLISQYATSCIDSSDGVLIALNTIADLNDTGFEITQVPYLKEGILLCEHLSIPKELLFIGECGEYELIFTLDESVFEEFMQKSHVVGFDINPVGRITEEKERKLQTREKCIDFSDLKFTARDFTDVRKYLNELLNYLS